MKVKIEGADKEFDFGHEDFFKSSKHRQEFYKNNYDSELSEEEFVDIITSMHKKQLHNSSTRSPSKARADYKRLKRVYGFFRGIQ